MYDCMSRCVGKFRVTGISGILRFRIEELEALITSVTSLDHFEYQCRPTQRSYNSCQEKFIQDKQKRSQLSAYYYSNCKFLESREEVHSFSSCLISLSGAQAWKCGPNLLNRLYQNKYNHFKNRQERRRDSKNENGVK